MFNVKTTTTKSAMRNPYEKHGRAPILLQSFLYFIFIQNKIIFDVELNVFFE